MFDCDHLDFADSKPDCLHKCNKKHIITLLTFNPNSDLSQTCRCSIKGLSVKEVIRIDKLNSL